MQQVSNIYAMPGWAENPKGNCLPDAVAKALIDAVLPAVRGVFEKHQALEKAGAAPELNRHRILIPAPRVPWEQSCKLAVGAINAASTELGERAEGVVIAKKRWKIVEAEPGDSWGFTRYPENPAKEKAMIEFGADGTICDAFYVAHELGHLLASDLAQEKRIPAPEFMPRGHLLELQGYFTQHALYAWLLRDPKGAFLKDEAEQHFIAEVTRSLYNIPVALAAVEAHRQHEKGDKDAVIKKQIADNLQKWLGASWESFAPAARLAQAGAEDVRALEFAVRNLHSYSAAAIMGAGLHERYNAMPPEKRAAVIEALYATGFRNTISDVLLAAGVDDKGLGQFMSDSAWAAAEPLQRLHSQGRLRRTEAV